jgi:cytidyltransferase-like protein
MKIGFTIGKFSPLHIGHQSLIERGISECDEFYILVNDSDTTKIPLDVRANWIKELYPTAHVIIGKNPPKQYGMDKESIDIQTNYLKSIFKDIPVNAFYSSEDYGEYVAKAFNIENVRVEKIKDFSATKFRNDPLKYKEFVNEKVYKDFQIYV